MRSSEKSSRRTKRLSSFEKRTRHCEERSDVVTEGNACGAIRSPSGPPGTGRCKAPQGMRIATSAFGLLAMTRKIEPGPSFGGAIRTPREGCPTEIPVGNGVPGVPAAEGGTWMDDK